MSAADNDTEKITINLVPVDLGKVDLLVEQGLFASRSDLIRTGIRRILEENEPVLDATITRHDFTVGIVSYGQADLQRRLDRQERVSVRTIGRLILRADVDPDTADAVFESITVRGSLKASAEVRARLKDRITT